MEWEWGGYSWLKIGYVKDSDASGSIICEEFLEWLSKFQLLHNDSATLSCKDAHSTPIHSSQVQIRSTCLESNSQLPTYKAM
jgi:hypothetical protein